MWAGLSVPYTRLLASLTETVVRLGERPAAVTNIIPIGTLMAVDRDDFPATPSSGRFGVESTDLTFNFIVLITLFAANRRTLSDRNVFGFAAAAATLVIVHVAAVVAFVEAYYASSFGAWSELHYGYIAQHFWLAVPYFYGVIGVYGSAVAIWWLFRPSADAEKAVPKVRNRRTSQTARAW